MSSESNSGKKKEISLAGEQRVLDAFDQLALEPAGNADAAWERFTGALAQKEKVKKIHPLRFYYVAASFIALVSLSVSFLYQYRTTTLKADCGEISIFYLPDSSRLMLNADSKVTLRKTGWSEKRRVALDGEVWFEVRKGKDFLIETPEATIKVLGTSFNVFSRNGYFSVKCSTGKIMVTSKAHRSSDTLSDREALDIPASMSSGIKKYNLGSFDAAAWINGEFYYDDVPLDLVIRELERQFNVKIATSSAILARHYSGYFKNDHLGRALEYVCTPMNLRYQSSGGNTIRIY
jgi:ferric-dicitrate binding protein FerR (iron transport regulator)